MHRLALCLLLSLSAVQAATLSETLPNGMKVVIKEDHRAPVAVSQLWYNIGSVDEPVGKTGLSHALEHMMFKGTAKVPSGQFSRTVAALGGEDNAYTNRNHTVYHETVAAANLPQVLAMEADRMVNLNFSDADFRNEMKVIREERRLRTDDQPGGVLWEGINQRAFDRAHNRAPVIGYMADLHALKAADLRRWYRQWYAPNNATLVVVGAVDAPALLTDIRQQFGAIPTQRLPERHLPAEKPLNGPRHLQVSAPSELPMVALAYRVPRLQKLDERMPYALTVLAEVLDGNVASRLEKNLIRQQAIATSVGANYDMFGRSEALFNLIGLPAQGVSVPQLAQAMQQQVQDIAANGVSAEELQRVRQQMAAAEVYERDSMADQASTIGLLETLGYGRQAEATIKENLRQVSAAEVQAAARLLNPRNLTQVVLKPLPVKANTRTNPAAGDAHVR